MHRNNSRRRAVLVPLTGLVVLGLITAMFLGGPFKRDRAITDSARQAPVPSTSPTAAPTSAEPSPSGPSTKSGPSSPSASPTVVNPVVAPTPKPDRRKGERVLTMVNRTSQTLWPALANDPKHPVKRTGWRLPPGGKVSIVLADHWDARIWARTGCTFNSAGRGHCVTGDCGGYFQCGSRWGNLPATLAEFNFNAWRGMDFYDVSLVDGNNVPMYINHTGGHSPDKISPTGCVPKGCTKDANATCPRPLQQRHNGKVVACKAACVAFNTDKTCCRAQWAPRSRCRPAEWPINSAAIFKRAEPFAYSYVNDDATSVFTCKGICDYRITFGPTK